jgi:hypothetical protein
VRKTNFITPANVNDINTAHIHQQFTNGDNYESGNKNQHAVTIQFEGKNKSSFVEFSITYTAYIANEKYIP